MSLPYSSTTKQETLHYCGRFYYGESTQIHPACNSNIYIFSRSSVGEADLPSKLLLKQHRSPIEGGLQYDFVPQKKELEAYQRMEKIQGVALPRCYGEVKLVTMDMTAIAFEYLRGPTVWDLAKQLKEGIDRDDAGVTDSSPPNLIITMIATVADAICDAFLRVSAFGIIHCDVKLDNVMLSTADLTAPRVYLIDFGDWEDGKPAQALKTNMAGARDLVYRWWTMTILQGCLEQEDYAREVEKLEWANLPDASRFGVKAGSSLCIDKLEPSKRFGALKRATQILVDNRKHIQNVVAQNREVAEAKARRTRQWDPVRPTRSLAA